MAKNTPHVARLTGGERAAILLLCLGEERAGQIFDMLDDAEVRLISRCMMSMDHITAELATQVMGQFQKSSTNLEGFVVDGSDFVRKAIEHSQDKTRKDMLLDQIEEGMGFRPLETIAMIEPRMVASLLQHEHPQTIALVLSTQTPEHTSKIIDFLPEHRKADLVYRMASIGKVSPEVINLIEESLRREIGMVANRDQQQVGGLDKVVEILGRMKGTEQLIINRIADVDQEMAEAIKKRMFTFEDLIYLDDRSMQSVMREMENETLTLALKTASDPLKDKIYANISQRAAEMIKDDLEALGPVRLSEVEGAQLEAVSVALRLEEEGTIIIPGRGVSDDVLV